MHGYMSHSLKLWYAHQLGHFVYRIHAEKIVVDVTQVLAARMSSSALLKIMTFGNKCLAIDAWLNIVGY